MKRRCLKVPGQSYGLGGPTGRSHQGDPGGEFPVGCDGPFPESRQRDGEAVIKATGQYRDFQVARADAALKAAQNAMKSG